MYLGAQPIGAIPDAPRLMFPLFVGFADGAARPYPQ